MKSFAGDVFNMICTNSFRLYVAPCVYMICSLGGGIAILAAVRSYSLWPRRCTHNLTHVVVTISGVQMLFLSWAVDVACRAYALTRYRSFVASAALLHSGTDRTQERSQADILKDEKKRLRREAREAAAAEKVS